jgi:hypothetical protein
MTTSALTNLEIDMLSKGYASSRMVAKKINRHFATVLRLLKEDKLKGVKIGAQNFVELESLKTYLGPDAVCLLNLNDWSDVANEI